jgi:hypothetical protein
MFPSIHLANAGCRASANTDARSGLSTNGAAEKLNVSAGPSHTKVARVMDEAICRLGAGGVLDSVWRA